MKTRRIAVVGGGPAGATCARELAESGARVDLFEASALGEKPCGGGVPSAVLHRYPELASSTVPRRVVREVVIWSPSDRRVSVPLEGGIHIFARHDLDAFLRERAVKAGAALRCVRVRGAHRVGSDRWELATDDGSEGPYDGLVAADGVRGAVRRILAGSFDDGELTLALYAYAPGVPSGEMVLKFFGDFDGYLWIFPRTDHVSVGICATHRTVTASRLADELHRFVERHHPVAVPAGALKGYFIPSCARRPIRSVGRGWALAGDAGGFVDPLTREGISWAMRSGSDVARHMMGAGEQRTPGVPAELRRAGRHAARFFRRDSLETMTRLASASSAFRRVLDDLLSGRQRYRSLKARLLLNALPCAIEVGVRSLASQASR